MEARGGGMQQAQPEAPAREPAARRVAAQPSVAYITAHYETGSFVWLSGAPESLVNNWLRKAVEYRKDLMK